MYSVGGKRRRGLLQLRQRRSVGSSKLFWHRRLEHREGLAELHGATLELTQDPEHLLCGALLNLGDHQLAGLATDPLSRPRRRFDRRTPTAGLPASRFETPPVAAGQSPTHCLLWLRRGGGGRRGHEATNVDQAQPHSGCGGAARKRDAPSQLRSRQAHASRGGLPLVAHESTWAAAVLRGDAATLTECATGVASHESWRQS